MKPITLSQVVVVEGKYDKIRLSSLLDATIITTDGFGIFRNSEKQALLRRMAQERGLILLTDSDSAGFVIRNFLRGCVPEGQIRHAYIPQLAGKEKRKTEASKEGFLGVEGMDTQTLVAALERAGISVNGEETPPPSLGMTKQRMLEDGLTGGSGSSRRRSLLAAQLGFPSGMTANALMEAMNILCDESAYRAALEAVNRAENESSSPASG